MPRKPTPPEERWSPLLPADDLAARRDYTFQTARGWGSIRVRIRIGKTEWNTSLLPDKKSGTYLFAIKADVRKAEKLSDGDPITAHIRVVQGGGGWRADRPTAIS